MYRAGFFATAVVSICVLVPYPTLAQDVARDECAPQKLEEARLVFHRAWFEEADELLRAYLAKCPNSALAHGYLAVVDMLLFRESADRSRIALQTANVEGDAGALFAKAAAHFAEGRLEQTEALLREYLEFRPTDRYARHFLGFTLLDQDKNTDGVRVLEDLLRSDPDYFPAKNHLAYGLLKTGNAESAIRIAAEFIEADRGNPSAWDTQAQMLQSVGRSEEAITSLSQGVLLDERFAYGFRHLGNIHASVGDNDSARAAYKAAIDASGQYGPEFVASVRALLDEMDEDQ